MGIDRVQAYVASIADVEICAWWEISGNTVEVKEDGAIVDSGTGAAIFFGRMPY